MKLLAAGCFSGKWKKSDGSDRSDRSDGSGDLSMEFKFTLTVGDRPLLTDSLGLDLTAQTVKLVAQGPDVTYSGNATITDAPGGLVSYRMVTGQTAVSGDYTAAWQVTNANGEISTQPTFAFQILPALPVAEPTSYSKLTDFYDDIRALTGDFKKRVYEDSAIGSMMRTQLRLGRVQIYDGAAGGSVWRLGNDGLSITPAILPADITAYSLLIYHTAHNLVLPDMAAYSYRTRALAESFGVRKDFLFNLQNVIYNLEDGEMIGANVTGLRSWLFSINGIWAWNYLQAERQIDLSFR